MTQDELKKLPPVKLHQLLNLNGELTQLQAQNLGTWGKLMGSEVLLEEFDRVETDFLNRTVKFYYKGPSKVGPRILAKATMELWVRTLLGVQWKTEVVCGNETGKSKGTPKPRRVRGAGKVPAGRKPKARRKHSR